MERTAYVVSPYTLLLRDKPNIFNKRRRSTSNEQAIKLEQYLNDLYHHFLYKLTSEMQAIESTDQERLRALFEEMLKTKKLLEETE
jgi:hypothetical protein